MHIKNTKSADGTYNESEVRQRQEPDSLPDVAKGSASVPSDDLDFCKLQEDLKDWSDC